MSPKRRRVTLLKAKGIDPEQYRDAMAEFAGAVHIVTTDGKAGQRGATVIAACSISDRPPMVLVCINRENIRNEAFAENGVFALNTLSADQQELAMIFSGQAGVLNEDRFAAASWERLATGAPVLEGALATFDCEIAETRDLATHRLYVGTVLGLKIGSGQPLIYHKRAYHAL